MAVRYSGSCTVRVRIDSDGGPSTPATYRVNIAACGRPLWSGYVHGAPADRRPIDAPEVYDEVAHAGLSFATHDGADIDPDHNTDGSGWAITRRKVSR